MCLGVPGKILEITPHSESPRFMEARVDFGGVARSVSLAGTPEARVGQYVVVHAGFALRVIDEDEARRVWEYLEQMDELDLGELKGPEVAGPDSIPAADPVPIHPAARVAPNPAP